MSGAASFRARVERVLAEANITPGTYSVPDLGPTPALWVGEPPEGTTLEAGLEVLIGETPQTQVISTFGGSIKLQSWALRLVNHGGADLEGAVDAIIDAFNPPTPRFIDEVADIAEQVLFSIPDDPES